MHISRVLSLCFALALLAGMALRGAADPTAPSPLLPITADDIDSVACKALVDGKPVDGNFTAGILAALGSKQGEGWSVGAREDGKARSYLLVLAHPVTVGALFFQPNGTLKYLKPGAEPNPADANAWTEVAFPVAQSGGRLATMPVGFSTRAFLCTVSGPYEWHSLRTLRLLTPRLYNIVPDGIANGEADWICVGNLHPPIPFTAANIVHGAGAWQSYGPDDKGHVPRTTVSEQFPTWFVVSWDTPHAMSSVLLSSNFRHFKLFSYKGPAGLNPAIGSENDWEPMKFSSRDGFLLFPPLTTRGLKFVGADTGEDHFGRIDGLQVYTDLKEAPAPERKAVVADPPCKISLTLPEDGYVTLAIDDAQGHRVRNVIAREEHKAGPLTVGWDMKDESGKLVAPGAYHWKSLFSPGLHLKYQMTAYPNVQANAPENAPWLNGVAGSGGWLADHSAPSAVCAAGDKMFISAVCCESGVALIECDQQGRKEWGHSNIIAWTGPGYMASDGKALYTAPRENDTDYVWRFALPNKEMDTMLQLNATATRRRGIRGMAARDGKLYLSINAGSDWMENSASAADVDVEHCEPRYGPQPKGAKYDDPDPRNDFLRLFRLTGTPSGCKGLIYLETAKGHEVRQHIVLAFTKAVPVGSFVFPLTEEPGVRMHISVLKPDAHYPPYPRRDADWSEVWVGKGSGWAAIPAPANTLTRAVRLTFDHGEDDIVEDATANKGDDPEANPDDNGVATRAVEWQAKLEGMKILRRRYTSLSPTCIVKVSSGTVTPKGEWDAKRDTPLTTADPGIYTMEWAAPQTLRGLAIKEIDGRLTDIDAWTGAEGVPVDMHDDAHWTKLTSYEQALRYYYQPDQNNNANARYIDGYVDFGRTVTTRAIRLRVVEQWLWKEDGRAGCVGVRRDRGEQTLDPVRCRIYGVSPLQYLGDEPPVDTLATERMEVYDTATAKLLKELPLTAPGRLTFAPQGQLYAISGAQVAAVDLQAGTATPLKLDVQQPTALACDAAGNIYVFDSAADQRVVKVFAPNGKYLHTIGTPGGRKAGPWDPGQFTSHPWVGVDLAIDTQNQLWISEEDFTPKRVSLWALDGTFKKDFLGNTAYGGGGCLDPYDKSRLFYGPLEFTLDWKTGASHIKGLTWLGDSPPYLGSSSSGECPIRIGDRHYLVTRPSFARQSVAAVYLEDGGRLKQVAAMGMAGRFPPLRTPDILAKLGRKPIGYCNFVWSDRNGDGIPQADEVEFFDQDDARKGVPGTFEDTLAIDSGQYRYEVKEILPNGVPVYERKKKDFDDTAFKLANGNFFLTLGEPNGVVTANGTPVWTYPAEGWGVHALYRAKPYQPAQVTAEFDIVGRDTAPAGDLGEFLVTNSNTGAWHIWTADGLLAGRLFRDLRAPGVVPWAMPEHQRGLDLTDVNPGQEHFSGYFCRSRVDNKYYIVAGHNHISVVEVEGIDKFKRLGGDINVSPEDLVKAVRWNRQALSRKLYEQARLITCKPLNGKITIDGNPTDWNFESARLSDRDVSFAMTYDDKNLYLCYLVNGNGPLANAGNDWRRLFKTGAAVDFQIGVDPAAPVDRTNPAKGDQRLLMTMVHGKPVAVLYHPNCPGARSEENWETHTDVAKADFDRVVELKDVEMAVGQADDRNVGAGYCLEAAIPLASLGLTIETDTQLKVDWGILVSGPNGTEVLQRLYWANPLTAIISDEPSEAQLHPDLWGVVRFVENGGKGDAPEEDKGL